VSATTQTALRIGEVAKLVGTTPRTIRYYEEIGLLTTEGDRAAGQHRVYSDRDVAHLRDALRLKELLGVSLDELKELVEAEDARAALREEWNHGEPNAERRLEIVGESLQHLDRQLELVRRRGEEIAALESELAAKRKLALRRRRELES
jgi:MerR family transcriptional regulator, repressor of the yfmOP operon